MNISNKFLNALCKIRIAGETRQILDVIINSTTDKIPLLTFAAITKIDERNVSRAINKLEKMNLITVNKDVTKRGNSYIVNKDYTTWMPINYSLRGKPIRLKKEKKPKVIRYKAPSKTNNYSSTALTHKTYGGNKTILGR